MTSGVLSAPMEMRSSALQRDSSRGSESVSTSTLPSGEAIVMS